jgi:hypothetical protein
MRRNGEASDTGVEVWYFEWDGRPNRESKELTPLHEALHAAVVQILGGTIYEITIDDSGGGETTLDELTKWQDLAVTLAPALINDISRSDAEYLKRQNHHRRGYAWGWLTRHRRRIIRRANSIVGEIGRPPGLLRWDPEKTRWIWKHRRKKC